VLGGAHGAEGEGDTAGMFHGGGFDIVREDDGATGLEVEVGEGAPGGFCAGTDLVEENIGGLGMKEVPSQPSARAPVRRRLRGPARALLMLSLVGAADRRLSQGENGVRLSVVHRQERSGCV